MARTTTTIITTTPTVMPIPTARATTATITNMTTPTPTARPTAIRTTTTTSTTKPNTPAVTITPTVTARTTSIPTAAPIPTARATIVIITNMTTPTPTVRFTAIRTITTTSTTMPNTPAVTITLTVTARTTSIPTAAVADATNTSTRNNGAATENRTNHCGRLDRPFFYVGRRAWSQIFPVWKGGGKMIYEKFLAEHGRTRSFGAFTQEEVAALHKLLPQDAADFLAEEGRASFAQGFFATVHPQDAAGVLPSWGIKTKGASVFLRSAFGACVYAVKNQYYYLDPLLGRIISLDDDLYLILNYSLRLDAILDNGFFREHYLPHAELGKTLTPDQILGFVPRAELWRKLRNLQGGTGGHGCPFEHPRSIHGRKGT